MKMRMPGNTDAVLEGVVFIGGTLAAAVVIGHLLGCDGPREIGVSKTTTGPVTITVTNHNTILPAPTPKSVKEFYPLPMLQVVPYGARLEECPSVEPQSSPVFLNVKARAGSPGQPKN